MNPETVGALETLGCSEDSGFLVNFDFLENSCAAEKFGGSEDSGLLEILGVSEAIG